MKHASILVIFGTLMSVGSLNAKWGRIPVMQEKPVNLAVKTPQTGTSIDSSAGIGQVDNLLGVEVTATATLGAGKSFFVMSFAKPVMVSTSSFANDGIEGKITLSASADKQGWAVLQEKLVTAADRDIQFKFAGIQAKFLKFDFILSKGGSIGALQVMGGATDRGYALKQDPTGQKGQPMNFVGGLGGARLIYAAPKPVNGLDTAANFNKFEFPESDEKYRTLIYDFGQVRILNEFSSVHSPSPVRFEVFSFEKLPEKEDWRGRLAFDPSDFNLKQPVVAIEDKIGTGQIKGKPASPVKTRYLALRWEPDFNPPAFLITGTGMMGNVSSVQGPTTTTTTVNGQTVTVTVDPGPAVGAGTSEAQATVTITTGTGPSASSVTYSGAGVTGVNISGGSIQIVTGNNPNTAPAGDTQPTVATVNVSSTGAISTAPTPVGFLLNVAPAASSGSVTNSPTPPAGASADTSGTAAAVVAAVLGVTTDQAAAAITAVASNSGSSDVGAINTAVQTAVTNTPATGSPGGSTGGTGGAGGGTGGGGTNNAANSIGGGQSGAGGGATGGGTINNTTTPVIITSP